MKIKFNTNGSHRLTQKVMTLLPTAWSMAASLNSKRRAFTASYNGDFEEIREKLKALGCTSIKRA